MNTFVSKERTAGPKSHVIYFLQSTLTRSFAVFGSVGVCAERRFIVSSLMPDVPGVVVAIPHVVQKVPAVGPVVSHRAAVGAKSEIK